MEKIRGVLLICLLLVLASGTSISGLTIKKEKEDILSLSSTITVDNEGDGNFLNLQSAVDAAVPGTKINVYSGTYEESSTIRIDVKDIKIEGFTYELGSGTDDGAPLIVGALVGDVINITADNVTIKGLVITHSGSNFDNLDSAIHVNSDENLIEYNYLAGNYYAITMHYANSNKFYNNVIEQNTMDGIYLSNSNDNEISTNQIINNDLHGIYLDDCDSNLMINNDVKVNGLNGVNFYDKCVGNIFYKNTVESNELNGVKLTGSDNYGNTIIDNLIKSNGWSGVQIQFSNVNSIQKNEISYNMFDGIISGEIADADGNIITQNLIAYNSELGIRFGSNSNDNSIYHNNIVNNPATDSGNNNWDNGYPSGGNYWSFYSGEDANDDGIIDISYVIPGGSNSDNYPLSEYIWAPEKPQIPIGSIIGKVGQSYQYTTSSTDNNGDKIQYGWDWNGDYEVDFWTDFFDSGATCTAGHSWDEDGTYFVLVKAMDTRGIESEWSDPLPVSMPRIKLFYRFFFERIIQFFPRIYELVEAFSFQ
jgi:parallel beta-helix repeat protein